MDGSCGEVEKLGGEFICLPGDKITAFAEKMTIELGGINLSVSVYRIPVVVLLLFAIKHHFSSDLFLSKLDSALCLRWKSASYRDGEIKKENTRNKSELFIYSFVNFTEVSYTIYVNVKLRN